MQRDNSNFPNLLYVLLAAFLLFIIIRIPSVSRMLPVFMLLGVLGFSVFYFINTTLKRRKQKQFDQTHEGIISKKIAHCKAQISAVEEELQQIRNSIRELEDTLSANTGLSIAAQTETKRIITAFQQELDLRNTKKHFYETCTQKLQALLYNYELSKTLEAKQATLRQLQERNQEDIVDFEQLKSTLAYEQSFLNSIDELSLRMLDSSSLQDAQSVQKELELITDELKGLN